MAVTQKPKSNYSRVSPSASMRRIGVSGRFPVPSLFGVSGLFRVFGASGVEVLGLRQQ